MSVERTSLTLRKRISTQGPPLVPSQSPFLSLECRIQWYLVTIIGGTVLQVCDWESEFSRKRKRESKRERISGVILVYKVEVRGSTSTSEYLFTTNWRCDSSNGYSNSKEINLCDDRELCVKRLRYNLRETFRGWHCGILYRD